MKAGSGGRYRICSPADRRALAALLFGFPPAGRDGRFHFDVALSAPVTGNFIVRYRGWLQPTGPDDALVT